MGDDIGILSMIISLGLSLTMLYMRKINWFSKFRYYISVTLLITGLIGFITSVSRDYKFLFYSMLVPAIYILIDTFFKYLSYKMHNRDFILYLSHSPDLEHKTFFVEDNENVKPSDVIFSFGLLILILTLTVFGIALFGKEDLYNKWF